MFKETPDWLTEIDHTGDVGIEVTAPSLEVLFERSALGLFGVLTDVESVAPRSEHHVTVEADDRQTLMAKWLSELNYLHVTKGLLFREFEITALNEHRLTAVARGERGDPDRHTVYTEIKAVTLHDLRVEKQAEHWYARVIFDM